MAQILLIVLLLMYFGINCLLVVSWDMYYCRNVRYGYFRLCRTLLGVKVPEPEEEDTAADTGNNGEGTNDCSANKYRWLCPFCKKEAVIISSEIKTPKSFSLLKNCVLNHEQHHEIRAGAAWALGEMGQAEGISTLISSFNALEEIIKVEAARSLAKFSKVKASDLIPFLKETNPDEKQGLAWAISRAEFKIRDLLPFLTDEESRKWISYIIGVQDKEKHLEEIESLREKDSEVYFAVTVLWKIMESWIFGLEEY